MLTKIINIVICILLGSFFVVAAFAKNNEPENTEVLEPVKLIISADAALGLKGGPRFPGVNDPNGTLAILLAMSRDEVDLLGVSLSYGNNTTEAEEEKLKELFQLSELESLPPVYAGAKKPLQDMIENIESCSNDAVEFMKQAVLENAGVTIVSVGPLTDVACLFSLYPEVLESGKVKELITVAGRAPNYAENSESKYIIKHTHEFNFESDMYAARIILEQDEVPVRFITKNVVSSYSMMWVRYGKYWLKSYGDYKAFLMDSITNWVQYQHEIMKEANLRLKYMPTAQHAVMYAMEPSYYTCHDMGYGFVNVCGKDEQPCNNSQQQMQLHFSRDYSKTYNQHTVCIDVSAPRDLTTKIYSGLFNVK